ncbi:hypothetical protein BKG76_00310 [Mycobacteroides franklinii]|uniref:Lipoprotein n=1 Tax=Mycobacteroides franklinii TaxID=948102 RepID=A0A1S1LGS2_9MYCO|nr:hypothetical protein [Mycobacteroides franklinii]OHU31695.1 hypothetical protein BKG76_00310 [Mycobacteroides franklinii]
MPGRLLRRQDVCTATVLALVGVCVLCACGPAPEEALADEPNDIYREVAQAVQNHNIDVYNALTCARQHWNGIDSIKSSSPADLPTPHALTTYSNDISVHGDVAIATLANPPGLTTQLYDQHRIVFRKENEGWKYCSGSEAIGIVGAHSTGFR